MNENDKKSNKRIAFINFYLAEKEFFLPDDLRSALDFVYLLIKKRGKTKASAIYIANEWYKNKRNIEYGKEFLWKKFNSRMALLKNATDKYYKWCIEMRKDALGLSDLCACGCGQKVKKGNKFIHGHHRRVIPHEQKVLNAKHMRDSKLQKSNKNIIDFKSYKNL